MQCLGENTPQVISNKMYLVVYLDIDIQNTWILQRSNYVKIPFFFPLGFFVCFGSFFPWVLRGSGGGFGGFVLVFMVFLWESRTQKIRNSR